jgi:hypothetical protein
MSPLTAAVAVLLGSAHAGGIPAVHGVLKHHHIEQLPDGLPQVLTLSAGDRPATFSASCTVGKQTHEAHSEIVPAGEPWATALPEVEGVTQATCVIAASFANGMMERKQVELQWTVLPPAPPAEEGAAPDQPQAPPERDEAKDQPDGR